MKQYWERLALKIDALTLRERTIIFAMAVLVLITLINTILLDPLYAKQGQLTKDIRQKQAQIAAIQAEIQHKASQSAIDPDSASKARLNQLREQSAGLHDALRDMQKGLVSPDKMPALLEDILRQNSTLRLVSLKTLDPSRLDSAEASEKRGARSGTDPNPGTAPRQEPAQPEGPPAREIASIYRHGVELQVQGRYFDLLDYLAQLEAMQWQLFWGKARLEVKDYPKATLTLTLYTLSLDKKWLNL